MNRLTVIGVTKALREGFTHGYVTSEVGDRQSVRFSVLVSTAAAGQNLFKEDFSLSQLLDFSEGTEAFVKPILDRWHRYMTLSKDELKKEDGVLHVPLLGPELAETPSG